MEIFLTSGDVAQRIKKSRDTVVRYAKLGRLKPAAKLGRGGRTEFLFYQSEIDRYLSSGVRHGK
jgi:hypothetical protein